MSEEEGLELSAELNQNKGRTETMRQFINLSDDKGAELLKLLEQSDEGNGEECKSRIGELSAYWGQLLTNLLELNIGLREELDKTAEMGNMFVWKKFVDSEYRILEGRGQRNGIQYLYRNGEYKSFLIYNGCYISMDELWNKLPKDDKEWKEDKEKRDKKKLELLREYGERNCGNCRKSKLVPSGNERCYEDNNPHSEDECCSEHKFYGEDD